METKMLEFSLVQAKFYLTEEQLNIAIKRMKKRHPFEEWIVIHDAPNAKDKIIYLRMEFLQWLEEVYFNRDGSYLDKEIAFFKKQILRLESELNIQTVEEVYSSLTLKELENRFDKKPGTIRVAIHRMNQACENYITKNKDGRVLVNPEGVKWLTEHYYRKQYLKRIEKYKINLQKIKKERRMS